MGGWAEQNMKDLLARTDFTKQTGNDVEVVLRTDTKETALTRLASAFQAGTSPYDVIDFEDELTTSFSQAGYVIGVDDLLPADFWDDFPPEMKAYSDVWSAHQGETFRIIHNWEMPYWWYRNDWFDQKVGLTRKASPFPQPGMKSAKWARSSEAHPRVDALRDSLAIQRGPMVYCVEAVDQPTLNLLDLQLDETAPLQAVWREELLAEGIVAIQTTGTVLEDNSWPGGLYRRSTGGQSQARAGRRR